MTIGEDHIMVGQDDMATDPIDLHMELIVFRQVSFSLVSLSSANDPVL